MILTVGLNCLDILSWVELYPKEDEDMRCTRQEWARGGNASNNATVLSCLGASVEFFGTLGNDLLLKFFTEDMERVGIVYDNCPIVEGVGRAPTSVVICSEETGSRTIVHNNGGLRELYFTEFESRIQLDKYSWIHFEGRSNEGEIVKMVERIQGYNKVHHQKRKEGDEKMKLLYQNAKVAVSIEVEKCRESLNTLLPLGHVLFVGKDFAEWQGAKDPKDAVKIMLQRVLENGVVVVCPWGGEGVAYGWRERDTGNPQIHKVDAVPASKIVDSLGAGDTFIATTIFCLNKGMDVDTSVRRGCGVASMKLSMYGFLGLKEKAPQLLSEGE